MANILAVDDEPAILEMIDSILKKDGHFVTKVSNPGKLNMEKLQCYDLILLDIMMPGMDGFEILSSAPKESPFTRLFSSVFAVRNKIGQSTSDLILLHNSKPSIPGIIMSSKIRS